MDPKKVIESNETRKQEISQELEVISSALEVEVEEQLAPIKAKALAEGAQYTKELLKLDTQIELMKAQVKTRRELDGKKQEAKDLAFELMSEDEKQEFYQRTREQHMAYLRDLREKYGLD